MAWLEITIDTVSTKIDSVVTSLTAAGFADRVIEDQEEFETFLEQNREYWDYIDEDFQEKLQGLSHIKVYLEDTDTASLQRLEDRVKHLGLTMQVAPMAEVDWRKAGKKTTRPRRWVNPWLCSPTGWRRITMAPAPR